MKRVVVFVLLFLTLLYGESLPLTFKGNEKVSESALYEALNLQKPHMYEFWKKEPAVTPETVDLLSESIKNYYRSRGYFHTSVTHEKKDGGVEILINEGAPVLVADIAIISKIDIFSVIPFKIGAVFDAQKFDASKKDIKMLYADKGYCNSVLEAKAWIDMETDSVYLVYEAISNELCYFGAVNVLPTDNIDADIIGSFLYIKEGKPFLPEDIRRSYKSLYARDGISKAVIDTSVRNANIASVNVRITETEKPIRFQAGVGVSSDEGLMGLLGIKHRNLYGNLKTLSLNLRVTEIQQSIKINFDMPLANRNLIAAAIGFENEKFPGFKEERILSSVLIQQRAIMHLFQESILLDRTTTYDSEDERLFLNGKLFVLSPKLEWNHDMRDNLLEPKKGYFLRSELMGSILSEISDATYFKYNISGAYIIPFLPSVVAFKAGFGSLHLVDGELPSSYRFFAGGMNSNRAYAYRKLGPTNDKGDPIGSDSIFEATAEYRFAIYKNFRGVVFNDNTFLARDEVQSYYKGYSCAGVGVRYMTPIGAIAIDAGFDIHEPSEKYAFHFHIGEMF